MFLYVIYQAIESADWFEKYRWPKIITLDDVAPWSPEC